MSDKDDLNEKMKNFNEQLLNDAAITFSLEGISKDLRFIINKKTWYCVTVFKQISRLIDYITTTEQRSTHLTKMEEQLNDLLSEVSSEIKKTNQIINQIADNLLENEKFFKKEKEDV